MHGTVSKDELLNNTSMERPHVVLLGAGASLAAFPNGEGNGKSIPLLEDLVEVVGLGELMEGAGVDHKTSNFEKLYSDICQDPSLNDLRVRA